MEVDSCTKRESVTVPPSVASSAATCLRAVGLSLPSLLNGKKRKGGKEEPWRNSV